MAARFRAKYDNEIKESLKKDLGITNPMAVPRLDKIVINMGLGRGHAKCEDHGSASCGPSIDRWDKSL